MKSLFAGIGAVALMLVVALLYIFGRSKEKRTSDWTWSKGLPSAIAGYFKALFSAKPAASEAPATPVAAAPAA